MAIAAPRPVVAPDSSSLDALQWRRSGSIDVAAVVSDAFADVFRLMATAPPPPSAGTRAPEPSEPPSDRSDDPDPPNDDDVRPVAPRDTADAWPPPDQVGPPPVLPSEADWDAEALSLSSRGPGSEPADEPLDPPEPSGTPQGSADRQDQPTALAGGPSTSSSDGPPTADDGPSTAPSPDAEIAVVGTGPAAPAGSQTSADATSPAAPRDAAAGPAEPTAGALTDGDPSGGDQAGSSQDGQSQGAGPQGRAPQNAGEQNLGEQNLGEQVTAGAQDGDDPAAAPLEAAAGGEANEQEETRNGRSARAERREERSEPSSGTHVADAAPREVAGRGDPNLPSGAARGQTPGDPSRVDAVPPSDITPAAPSATVGGLPASVGSAAAAVLGGAGGAVGGAAIDGSAATAPSGPSSAVIGGPPAGAAAGGQRAARAEPNVGSGVADRARLVQRVSKAFQKIGVDGGRIRIRLHPAELGSVRLEMQVQGKEVRARVVVETEAARSLLREHLHDLRLRLTDHGMHVQQLDVELGDATSGGSEQGGQPNDLGYPPPEQRRRGQRTGQPGKPADHGPGREAASPADQGAAASRIGGVDLMV